MKKLSVAIGAVCFVFASCSNPQETTVKEDCKAKQECQKQDQKHNCCKEISAEEKAFCDAWKDWKNQTPEKKAELISKQKERINGKMAEWEAKEAEAKAKREEFKTKWSTFDQLDIEAQKTLIDEYGCWNKRKHHHKTGNSCKGEK